MIRILTMMLLSLSTIVEATTQVEFGAAINVAGRQRMLTQKMAKEALMVHLKIDEAKNKENLNKTMGLFRDSLAHLQKVILPAISQPRRTRN